MGEEELMGEEEAVRERRWVTLATSPHSHARKNSGVREASADELDVNVDDEVVSLLPRRGELLGEASVCFGESLSAAASAAFNSECRRCRSDEALVSQCAS